MYRNVIMVGAMAIAMVVFAETPTVTDVVAKQRYPWNGLVDITCKVSGISGTTNGLTFTVAAVMPDSGSVRKVSHFWVVQDGMNSTDREVHVSGDYHLLWDAQEDIGQVIYSNMVLRVMVVELHSKVQLWEGGPYWATTNIGAEEPWEYGYYFWWGDTLGYKRRDNAWVASDGSSSSYSFDKWSTPTYNKDASTLQNEGWITADRILAPQHDAARMQWGGGWRMPTKQEESDLHYKCDWIYVTTNDNVTGYIIRGRGDYASACIFLPTVGYGNETALNNVGTSGGYWSSVPDSDVYRELSWCLSFDLNSHHDGTSSFRYSGKAVRPVQGSND